MSNVIYINGAQQSNAVQLEPDDVLNKAIGEYESILMIGYNKAGELDVRGSTNLSKAETLWLVSLFQHKLLNGDYLTE